MARDSIELDFLMAIVDVSLLLKDGDGKEAVVVRWGVLRFTFVIVVRPHPVVSVLFIVFCNFFEW